MSKTMIWLLSIAVVCALTFQWVTAPANPPASPGGARNLANGEVVFNIAGCASCHSAPKAEGEEKLLLSGGKRFPTEFGVFIAPNISPDPAQGIGGWNEATFLNAVLNGVSLEGEHYYPAFPYASYARMTASDAADLWAYIQTLPPSSASSQPSEVGFPFSIRRGLGLWKRLHVRTGSIQEIGEADPVLARGRYLVEGPGHCGECHTPRDISGGMVLANWLGGAPSPDGPGRIPALAGPNAKVGEWSVVDIAEYLRSGFTPEYDSAGGAMVDVIENTAKLSDEDRMAIATYLKTL